MKMHPTFFAFLCLSFLVASAPAESTSTTVNDHGPVAPVAFPVFGGSVATIGPDGDRVVVCPVWVGWNEEGVRGSAFLTINVDKSSTTLTQTVYGDTAFGSFLSDANKLYFAQDGQLVEFDVGKNRVRELGKHPNRIPIWFTSDDQGRIYFVCYPNAELVRYDPQTGDLQNFGPMAKENWPQYPRIDLDESGWAYIPIRHKEANIIGFHPATGERRTYLQPEERKYVDEVSHYRAKDGAVYIKLDSDNKWRRFHNGEMQFVDRPNPRRAVYRNATRSPHLFPDGSRVSSVNIPQRHLKLHEADGSERIVRFDYEVEGARIYSVTALNERVYGSTGLPSVIFNLDTKTGEMDDTQVSGVLHMNVWTAQNGKLYGGAYSNGHLFEYDPANDFQKGFKPVFTAAEARDYFGRPFEAVAHSDGKTVILTGNPARALEGGGMLLYDTHAGKGRIVKPEQLIPGQAIKSLVVLESGDLLGGTTTGAATGGTRVASEAEIFRLSWPDLKVTARRKMEPSTTAISDLLLARNNLVFGLTSNRHLFVIDPKTNKTVHTEQLLDYGEIAGAPGLQTTNVMVAGDDNNIYILFAEGIARVNIESFSHKYIYASESKLSGSITRVKDTLYFASGTNLLSLQIP